ncbi:60S acidic ribosomal protein P2A [Rosa chinensis]|nr:60S acidic ribosomal protein P2A [Rosa chinensis]
MKVVAAYLLTVLDGNTSPSVEDLKTILASVGTEVDSDRIKLVLSELEGKNETGLFVAMSAAAEQMEEKVQEKEESNGVPMDLDSKSQALNDRITALPDLLRTSIVDFLGLKSVK